MRPQRVIVTTLITPFALALTLGGCTKKEEEKKPEAADPAKAGAADPGAKTDGPPSAAETKVADVSVPGDTRLAHEDEVFGHFALPNTSKLLADVKNQLVNPQYQNFLDEGALRSLVSLSLDKQGMVAQNVDLAAPMGCAVVDFKTYEVPLACTFAYKGGVEVLLKDLGKLGRKPDDGGHAAVYTVEGKDVFVDSLGDHVVVAAHPELFAKTKTYLKTDIIDRGQAMVGDVEIVAYTADIWGKYEKDIQPLLALMDQASSTPEQTGNPKLDAAIKKWAEYNTTSTQQSIARIAQYEQLSLYLSVAPHGVSLGVTMVPTPGSDAEKDGQAYGGRVLDPAFIKALPAGSLMVGAFNSDPKAQDTKQVQEVRDLAIDTWSDLAGLDKAGIKESVLAFQAEGRGLYDGLGAFAVFDQEGATFAALAVQHLRPGVSARESWRAWTTKFTPEAALGEFSRFVTWEFQADASKAGDVPVDRWVIKPGPELEKEINKKLAEDPEVKKAVDQYWGPIQLTFDRAETNGVVLYVVAPKGEEAAMRRAIAAQQGDGSLGDDPGITAILRRAEGASGLFAFDLKATFDWLKGFPQVAEELNKIPGALGSDLSDIYMTAHYLQSGVSSFEYVVSQPMIEQIKDLVEKAG
ncbi:MAG: hypothetical protein KC486_08945 [Myxococcales bacterium]|nr:hypothetical protein [Myxococcales bacterium]